MEWDDALILWRCCVKSHSNLWNAWWETLLIIINYRMGIRFLKGKYLSMPKFLFLNIISMKYVLHILSHDWVITHCHDPRSICFLTYLASFVKKPIMHTTHPNIIVLQIMQIIWQESLMISTKIYFLPNTELKMLLLRASLYIFEITRKVCRKSCLNMKRI